MNDRENEILKILIDTLNKAIERIRSGKLNTEAQVKQSAIMPIIRALGWDHENPDEFRSEYPIPDSLKRADYALCRSYDRPLVFIEAKKHRHADENGEDQLFKYAYGQGVPFLILTDGDAWNFYLSMGEGLPTERRFYRVILTAADKIENHARNFVRFLEKENVLSGESDIYAKKQHDSNKNREKAREEIPKVWRSLLEQPESELRDILAINVANKCGMEPEPDDLDAFLQKQLGLPRSSQSSPPAPSQPAPSRPAEKRQSRPVTHNSGNGKIVGYVFNGQERYIGSANHTLAAIVQEFAKDNPQFLLHFAAETGGRTRRLVAQNKEDLYDLPHLRDYAIALDDGWWLGSNISAAQVGRYIELACKISRVNFGSQLTLIRR